MRVPCLTVFSVDGVLLWESRLWMYRLEIGMPGVRDAMLDFGPAALYDVNPPNDPRPRRRRVKRKRSNLLKAHDEETVVHAGT